MFANPFRRAGAPRTTTRKPRLPTFDQLEDRVVPNSMPVITNPGTQYGTEGNAFSLQIVASADPGGDPLTYSVGSGMLYYPPPGVTINNASGLLSGVVGYSAVSLGMSTATSLAYVDVAQGTYTAAQSFNFVITNTPLLQPATWSVSEGQTVTNDPRTTYGQSASGLTYSVTGGWFGPSLPPGLSLATNGQVTGVVDYSAVTFGTTAVYTATEYAASGTFTESTNESWVITNTPLVTGNTWSVSEGQTVTDDPRSSAGQGASGLTYSVSGGSLPPGLSLASNGQVTGVPGYSAVTFGSTASYSETVTVSKTGFSETAVELWIVSATPLLQGITPTVTEGLSVTLDPRTTFGQSASGLTYSVSGGSLPSGLSLASNGQVTGAVSYSVVSVGASATYSVTEHAASGALTESATLTLVVVNPPVVQAQSWSVSEGQSVSDDPRTGAGQGASGLTYSLSSGSMPPGLSLSSAGPITGAVDYTAAAPGATSTYSGVVTATKTGLTESASLTWVVVDQTPTVQFTSAGYSVNQNGGTATIAVSLPAHSSNTITVHYSTSDGTASAGLNYTSTSGNVTFSPTDLSKTFTVPILNDTLDDPTETFGVSLSSPSSATLGVSYANVTIVPTNLPPVAVNDGTSASPLTTNENTSLGVNVLSNDSDPNSDRLTVIDVTQPADGTTTINSDNTIEYVPNTNYYGADSFTYTMTDGHLGDSTATVFVSVTHVNQPPVALPDDAATPLNTAVTVPVLANDSDPDGDTLSVSAVGSASHGTVAIAGGSTAVTYTPTTGYLGLDSFSYTISDGHSHTASATVHVIVGPGQWATSVIGASSSYEDGAEDWSSAQALGPPNTQTEGDLGTAWAPSPENGSIEWLAVGFATADYATGVLIHETDGNGFVTQIELRDTGGTWHTITTPTDTSSGSAPADFLVTFTQTSYQVNGVRITVDTNHDLNNWEEIDAVRLLDASANSSTGTAPTAGNASATPDENDSVDVNVLADATNTAGTPLFLSIASDPANGTATINDNDTPDNLADDTITYTPNPSYRGSDSFTYTLTSIYGQQSTATVSVTVNAVYPVPTLDDVNASADKSTATDIDVLAASADADGDPLTLSVAGSPAHGTATVNTHSGGPLSGYTITYTPTTGYVGLDQFTCTVDNGEGGTATDTVYVTVYQTGQWASSVIAYSSQYDTSDNAALQALGAPDTFSYGDNTTAWAPSSENGTSETLTLGYATPAQATGVVVRETDGNGFITEVELQDSGGSWHTAWSGTDPATAGKPTDFTLTFAQTSYSVQAVRISVDTDHDSNNYEEIDAVRLLTGGSPGSTSVTTSATDQPPDAEDAWATTQAGDAVTVPVLVNDSDPDGDTLSVSAVGSASHGTVAIAGGSLAVTYTPTSGYSGPDSFTYTISDGTDTATATVHMTVYALGEWASSVIAVSSQQAGAAPAGYALAALGAPDTFAYGDAPTAWSPQYEDAGTQTLTVGFATADYATGVVVRETDGNGFVTKIELLDTGNAYHTVWTGTDSSGDTAPVDFTQSFSTTGYQVKGMRITVDTTIDATDFAEIDAVRLFTVTATSPTGTAPTASSFSLTTAENLPINTAALSSIASDAYSDPLTFTIVSAPANGTVDINDAGTPGDTSDDFLRYTPDAGYSGSDSFTYAVSDPWGNSTTGTVSVTVSAVNQPPVTQNDSAYTTPATAVTVDVLANDSDPENDTLSVTGVTQGQHGTVSYNGTTYLVTYTPTSGYSGVDQFAYTVSDGHSHTATGYVNVIVYATGAWASAAPTASSGLDGTGQATAVVGAPDDSPWTPSGGTAREFVTADYATAAQATGVVVREEAGDGAVTQVDLTDSGGTVHTIWSGSDPTASSGGTPVDFVLAFPQTSYSVAAVTVYVTTANGAGSIDAVRLLTGGSPGSTTVSGRGFDSSGNYDDTTYNSAGQPTLANSYTAGQLVQSLASTYSSGVLSASDSTDADGRDTRTTFDASGNALTVTQAYGTGSAATTTNTYTNGYLATVTDPDGNETQYTRDAAGDELTMTDPLGNVEYRTYTSAGQLATLLNRDDLLTTYAYDSSGNLTTETLYAGSTLYASVSDTLTWTYTPNNQIATASNAQGTYTFLYDANGNVLQVSEPAGVSLTFAYDSAGNRILVKDSLGGTEWSSYDGNGNLISRTLIQGSTALRIDQTFDQLGRVTSQTRYSDAAGTTVVAVTKYSYDAAGNQTSIVDTNASATTIADFDYTYSAAGNLTQQVENGTTTNFTYDALDQLSGDGTNSYATDGNGNRTGDTYQTGDTNELIGDADYNYRYDADGNETAEISVATGATWVYTYDNRDNLTSAKESTADPLVYTTGNALLAEVDYKYDAYGNRTEMDVDPSGPGTATVTKFAVDGWNPAKGTSPVGLENFDVWADLSSSGALETRYLRGDAVDQLLARIDKSGSTLSPYWYLTDHLGSVRDVIDNTATVKDAINYDAFGNILAGETDPTYRGRYAWTGREYDVEDDLQYNRGRYYDAQSGRWISQDPLGFAAGDSNLYRYVNNRPTTAADPSGLAPLAQDIDGGKLTFDVSGAMRRLGVYLNIGKNVPGPFLKDGVAATDERFSITNKEPLFANGTVAKVLFGAGATANGSFSPVKDSKSDYYFSQYALNVITVFGGTLANPKDKKQILGTGWFMDTRDKASKLPNRYRYQQTMDGKVAMDDRPTFFFKTPTLQFDVSRSAVVDAGKEIIVALKSPVSRGIINVAQQLQKDHPDKTYYVYGDLFRSYLVKVDPGKNPQALGYVQWGFETVVDLSEWTITTSPIAPTWVPFDAEKDTVWNKVTKDNP